MADDELAQMRAQRMAQMQGGGGAGAGGNFDVEKMQQEQQQQKCARVAPRLARPRVRPAPRAPKRTGPARRARTRV